MILFLDFDGVMHPFGCAIDHYFCHLELLEAWLRRRSGVDIVISSSWREAHPFGEIQSYFSADIQARVIGATPILKRSAWAQYDGEAPPTRFERELEITRWLNESKEPWRSWAAVDDQAWLFRPFNSRVVLCDGRAGLSQRELDRLDVVLGIADEAPAFPKALPGGAPLQERNTMPVEPPPSLDEEP